MNGKQYGVPYDLHTVGFWYRKDLFAKAGITSPPATLTDLDSDVTKLKNAAHRARSRWAARTSGRTRSGGSTSPLRECPTATLKAAMKSVNLSALVLHEGEHGS